MFGAPFGLVGKLYCCLPWRYRKTRGVEGESENNRGIWGEIENARVYFYLSKIGLQFFFFFLLQAFKVHRLKFEG